MDPRKEPDVTTPVWNTTLPSSRQVLLPDEVHVWHVPLSLDRALLPAWTRVLSVQERLIAAGFPSERTLHLGDVCEMTRENYIAYRSALRLLLARYLGHTPEEVIIATDAHGKPFLDTSTGGDLFRFNSSHSWGHALIALTRRRSIGIDLQRIDPSGAIFSIAQNRFSPRTFAALQALPIPERLQAFFRLWSLHEAYFKYLGCAESWKDVTILLASSPGEPAILQMPWEQDSCALCEIDPGLPGYTAALAVTGPQYRLSYWQLPVTALAR